MENIVTMSFDNGRNRVRIQKSTLDALGKPDYIILLCNKHKRKLILMPTTLDEARKYGVSEWNTIFIPDTVYSAERHYEYQNNKIMPWLRSFTKWKSFAQYRVRGRIRNGMAFMDLDDYEIIVGKMPLRVVGESVVCSSNP